jgi:hypothetical protein
VLFKDSDSLLALTTSVQSSRTTWNDYWLNILVCSAKRFGLTEPNSASVI